MRIKISGFTGKKMETLGECGKENFSDTWHEIFQWYQEKYGHLQKFRIKWEKIG